MRITEPAGAFDCSSAVNASVFFLIAAASASPVRFSSPLLIFAVTSSIRCVMQIEYPFAGISPALLSALNPVSTRSFSGVEADTSASNPQWWFVRIKPSGETNSAVQPMLRRITASVNPTPVGLYISCGLIFRPRFFRCVSEAILSGVYIPSSTLASAKEKDDTVTATVRTSDRRVFFFRFIYQISLSFYIRMMANTKYNQFVYDTP